MKTLRATILALSVLALLAGAVSNAFPSHQTVAKIVLHDGPIGGPDDDVDPLA